MRVGLYIVVLVSLLAIANGFKPKKPIVKGLVFNFYSQSCPEFESTVRSITRKRVYEDRTLQPKLLRLHYHDCFVRGCDASILLDSPTGDNSTEKSAGPNRSIAGYEVIDEIKAKLPKRCRKVVSCADIVAVAAKDAVSFGQKDLWKVKTGRRDGRVSIAAEASRDLPSGGSNFTTLLNLFARFGLNKIDLVALSGAHTIGVTHCVVIQRRLNFTGNGKPDPDLSEEYANELKLKCGTPPSPTTTLGLDRKSPTIFNSDYYSGLTRKEGLLTSDAALLKDPEAQKLVRDYTDFGAFKKAFAQSMMNMGNIQVLTGNDGEIRQNCRRVNPIKS